MRKMSQEIAFEYWLSYMLLPSLGEKVLSLTPSKKLQTTCFFENILKVDQSCCCNDKKNEPVGVLGGRFVVAVIQLSLVKNIDFTIRSLLPDSQKQVSWLFKSSVKTDLGNIIPFLERRGQRGVFCEGWLPYLLLPLLNVRVLSDDFPPRNQKHPFYFRKFKIITKVLVVMKKKIEQVCFSGKFEVATIQLLLHECTSFTIRPQIPGSKKHAFMQFQSCIRTLLGHTVQIHENRGQRTVYLECWLPYLER